MAFVEFDCMTFCDFGDLREFDTFFFAVFSIRLILDVLEFQILKIHPHFMQKPCMPQHLKAMGHGFCMNV